MSSGSGLYDDIFSDPATRGDAGNSSSGMMDMMGLSDGEIIRLRNEVATLQEKLRKQEEVTKKVKDVAQKWQRKADILEKNMSVLYNTAKSELARKDRRIKDLEAKVQSFEISTMKPTNAPVSLEEDIDDEGAEEVSEDLVKELIGNDSNKS